MSRPKTQTFELSINGAFVRAEFSSKCRNLPPDKRAIMRDMLIASIFGEDRPAVPQVSTVDEFLEREA